MRFWIGMILVPLIFSACGPSDDSPEGAGTAVTATGADFLQRLPRAAVEARLEEHVKPVFTEINGVYQWGFSQHSGSTIRHEDVFIGPNATLEFSIGIREGAWGGQGDGVRYLISIEGDNGLETVFDRYIDPKNVIEDRRWIPCEVNLSDFANQTVALTFETRPGASDDDADFYSDWSVWASPMLRSDGREVQRAAADRPNVVLITMDTTRAGHLACYGNPWVKTDNLDYLARNGVQFMRAWTASPQTVPSHASLMTSLPLPAHGVINQDYRLNESIPTLTKQLKSLGYRTAAAVSMDALKGTTSGLGLGFDRFEAPAGEYIELADLTRSGAVTTSAAIEMLEDSDDGPLFLWVHYFDPHEPYLPVGEYHKMYYPGDPTLAVFTSMEDASYPGWWYNNSKWWLEGIRDIEYFKRQYGAEITYMDGQIGRLLEALKRLNQLENTLVVATADHGENFGAHGVYFNHFTLFNTDMHVPLIVHYPEAVPPGNQYFRDVSILDVAPTVLGLVGGGDRVPSSFKGRDLAAVWNGETQTPPEGNVWPPRIVTAHSFLSIQTAGWNDTYKVVWELRDFNFTESHQVVQDRVRVYDREGDFHEIAPVATFFMNGFGEDREPPLPAEGLFLYPNGQDDRHAEAMAHAKRAASKAVPSPVMLRERLANPREGESIDPDLLENAPFFVQVVDILNQLQRELVFTSMPEPVAEANSDSGFESVPLQDPKLDEKLRALGYTE